MCLVSGKLQGRSPVKQGAGNINLCFASDTLHHRQFLIDTGAEVSVIPATFMDKQYKPPSKPLTAANGSYIATYGSRKLQFRLDGELYEWQFIVADVERPLLGADFLRHAGLLVNVSTGKLINPNTLQTLQLTSDTCCSVLSATKATPNSFPAIMDEFPSLTIPAFDLP